MIVVITGASRGIGFAIAKEFAKNGHHLCITSHNPVKLYKAMEFLQTNYGHEIHAKAFDLSVKENAVAYGNWCLNYGSPDIVINNAGIFKEGSIAEENEGAMEELMNTNFYSAFYLTQTLLPSMVEKKSGHIFNICSIASLDAYPNGGLYGISKFALYGFSKNLREELKLHSIKVTSVLTGAVMTDSWEGFDNKEKRIMEAEDIAHIVYAASQLSIAACVEDIVLRPQLGDL
ncbi:MAG TPA: SDR family oxidoreductase [Niabella sp.]|jgi:short-subunit dehydrogenase|nr:SDR family oxidoreductase [Chitinophagaceae bacterium]HRN47442.1 SDR family oxidoreductase [Niabella sp.]HRO83318.1 SDR family oxidoreductase [Niabella sp.]